MTGAPSEAAFSQAVMIALVVLTVVALVLTVAAVVVHALSQRTAARRAERWRRWEPLLLDALVGDREPSSLALLVRRGERGDYFRLLIAYALRLRGENREALAEAAAPHLDSAHHWLRHRRADRRALAVHLFGLLGSAADLRRLRLLLNDPSPDVAMTAARALARSGDLAYARPLIHVLDRFETWGPQAVASTLTLFGVEGGPLLQRGLTDPTLGETARAACAEALRRLGYVPAADAAVEVLTADPPPPREVQLAALRLLRDTGGPGHAETPRALSAADDDMVRLHAVSALASLSLRPDDAARIEHALSDSSPWVALRAARGLVESGRTASLQAVATDDTPRGEVARQALAEAGLLTPPT